MNLPINTIPRKQKQPPKRNSSGGFLFCPQASDVMPGGTIENQGLVCPNSLIRFIIPEILHIFVAVIRFSCLPDNRAGEDGCGFHFHDANHWLDISFLFHIYFYYYFLLLDDNLHGLAATLYDVHTLLQILEATALEVVVFSLAISCRLLLLDGCGAATDADAEHSGTSCRSR